MKNFGRHTTNFTIANIWEFYKYDKFKFNPPYQRNGDVWNEDKQSFLIDSIIKNFPLPPIFLHEYIDSETGRTCYDVIDGKQRLQTIIKFIEGNLSLPLDCSLDGFVTENVDGKRFNEFIGDELSSLKKSFWQYELSIEFIDSENPDVIDNIFDRLNRNGEPLNAQEFRNAKYHDSSVYKCIEELTKHELIQQLLCRLDKNRKEDIEFCSELFYTIAEGTMIDSNREKLNTCYEKYCGDDKLSSEDIARLHDIFCEVEHILSEIIAGFNKYYINSVSHLYALWGLAWQVYKQEADVKNVNSLIPKFYGMVKDKADNEDVQNYILSMQQATKSQASRKKRINALLSYMGLNLLK